MNLDSLSITGSKFNGPIRNNMVTTCQLFHESAKVFIVKSINEFIYGLAADL